MRLGVPLAYSSVIVGIYVLTWTLPMFVSLYFGEMQQAWVFAKAAAVCLSVVGVIRLCCKTGEVKDVDGFFVVVLSWLGLSFASSLPFYWSAIPCVYENAWFEAASGITTTGIEIIGDIAMWPKGLLWYRQQLEWVGGVGVIIMTLSLLSFQEGALLSIYNSEFGKDVRDVRMTPRLESTARYVCVVYGVLWFLCMMSHVVLGVPLFYAATEAMATVSTGGFSIQPLYPVYDNPLGQWVAIVFMVCGAIGLHTHYQLYIKRRVSVLWQHTEVRLLCVALMVGFFLCAVTRIDYDLTTILFEVAAFVTTTGFETNIHTSSAVVAIYFILAGVIGACAGSTAGGIKFIRVSVMWQEARLFLLKLVYPKMVRHISLDNKVLSAEYVASVRGYFALFLFTFVSAYVLLLATGMALAPAFYWVCAVITNVGASVSVLDIVGLTMVQKYYLSIIMLIGRVEIAAFFVVCMPRYWQT